MLMLTSAMDSCVSDSACPLEEVCVCIFIKHITTSAMRKMFSKDILGSFIQTKGCFAAAH